MDIQQNQDKFIKIIKNSVENISGVGLINDLSEIFQDETGVDIEKAKKIVDDISRTIDLIDTNYQDLKKAKEEGKNRTEWLRDKIGENLKDYSDDKKEDFIKEVKNSLDSANKEIGIEIFDKDLNLSRPLKSYKYDDLNSKAIINDFQEQVKNNTILGAVINENGIFKIDTKHQEIKAVKQYFEEKLDSPYDKNFKKAISVATEIAKDKDLLPKQVKNKTPEEISMIVDKGMTSAKVAYKLAKGELNPMDAVEYTIDRNTAILNSAIVTTTTKYGGAIGGKVGGFIGSVFGPAGTIVGTTIGTVVGKVAGHAVGKFISTGVKKIASVAKSVASSIGSGIQSVVSTIGNGLKSGWNSVTSFFGF